jgi:hypothetical protein
LTATQGIAGFLLGYDMKKLILALALLPTLAQADKPTVNMCRDAVNAMSFAYAYESICGGGAAYHLDLNMNRLKSQGCTSKVSLNDIRLAISRDVETLRQLNYETPVAYNVTPFCQMDDVVKERNNAFTTFNKSTDDFYK